MSSWTDLGSGMRLPTDADLTTPPLTDEQRHQAALEVCSRAVDATEAVELLTMLGLVPS